MKAAAALSLFVLNAVACGLSQDHPPLGASAPDASAEPSTEAGVTSAAGGGTSRTRTLAPFPNRRFVAAGDETSLAITASGTGVHWGAQGLNAMPENVSNTYPPTPTPTPFLSANLRSISTACAVRDDGRAVCFGFIVGALKSVQYGGEDDASAALTDELPGVIAGQDWVYVTGDAVLTCGIREDGSAACWGTDRTGFGAGPPTALLQLTGPTDVALPGAKWIDLSAAGDHAVGITTDGTLWGWGNDVFGEVGARGDVDVPTPISTLTGWDHVGASFDEGCASRGAELYCWGNREMQDAGVPGPGGPGLPVGATLVATTPAGGWSRIAPSGVGSLCAIDTAGALFCGDTNTVMMPLHPERQWLDVALGYAHMCAMDTTGAVLCCGRNDLDQIGAPGDGGVLPVGILVGACAEAISAPTQSRYPR